MANKELNDLPPEERIKRLKELEKERKKEIEEAQKVIKESEEEITERRRWVEKVPIPLFAKEDFVGLSEEGKEILRQKGIKNKGRDQQEIEPKPHRSLEEAVAFEKAELTREAEQATWELQQKGIATYRAIAERPMEQLQREMVNIYQATRERGYTTAEEAVRAFYATQEIERREEKYSFTEETAREASLIKKLGDQVKSMYKK